MLKRFPHTSYLSLAQLSLFLPVPALLFHPQQPWPFQDAPLPFQKILLSLPPPFPRPFFSAERQPRKPCPLPCLHRFRLSPRLRAPHPQTPRRPRLSY